MAKKEIKQMNEEVKSQELESTPTSKITNYALSMIQNKDESYSVIRIGFNTEDLYVSPVIEVMETNTDKYIVQERLSILLLELELS